MKFIVSHDVDHLHTSEHSRDGILVKFVVRSLFETGTGRIGPAEFRRRIQGIVHGRWHHLEEIMRFDEDKGVPSTFFFGTAKGLGLSYNLDQAASWISNVESRGFDTGVHGIAFNVPEDMKKEKEFFAKITKNDKFGIRMHYLRMDSSTQSVLASLGYLYDATPYSAGNPWKVERMPVFPLHIMDGRMLESGRFGMQIRSRSEIIKRTEAILRREEESGTELVSLLFHDRYYSDEFETWKWWYETMIESIAHKGYSFISYREACQALSPAR